jgi:hypothetical protein
MEAFVESIEVKILVFVELLEFEIGILVVLLEVEIGVFVELFVGRKLFDRVEGGDCTAFSSSNFLEFLVFLLKGVLGFVLGFAEVFIQIKFTQIKSKEI